ncbi:glycerophosphodiester phosphodiesterase family protein [Mesonia aestuariivivens]|uniref:Glycerophosphodiester phosphodiesterase n=1 Tax=Mesonia aestuariivivens TaxID=2796128 RepID=A0ABS6W326_9FLAO|nr:glycerophosphodiester phosphodiesterase family protein [Mesonia aestuariivivens]MBW2962272.1 glycerophosphodiester phosphodiesterase [Mesonia aestuariivivens]
MEVQGHRGDRGNFPENSIPAFISAVKKGVEVLEMDVVISKDNKVVVSHEPYMSSLYMLQPNGKSIKKEEEKDFNLYLMNYDEIREFDGGSKSNKKFLQQQKIKTHKPLLSEVIDTVENYIKINQLPAIKYNIELKSEVEEYNISQPLPEQFVALVINVLQNKQLENRVSLQSFDVNILEKINQIFPQFVLAYLVEEGNFKDNTTLLSFKPDIYSPFHQLLSTQTIVNNIQQEGIKVIPWTVNTPEAIKKLIEFGVDGIISDYPELVLKLREEHL